MTIHLKHQHHRNIVELLRCMSASLLEQTQCYFGGGTAIVMELGEYRLSDDIDLLCASAQGYRTLRNTITHDSLAGLLQRPVHHLRPVTTDQYKIVTALEFNTSKIKLEILSEGRMPLQGCMHPDLGVPVLSREDMFAQKLLANTDRGLDKATANRDAIDLAMMIRNWGAIPQESWDKAESAYGESMRTHLHLAAGLLRDPRHLNHCMERMRMDMALAGTIATTLDEASASAPLSEEGQAERVKRIEALPGIGDKGGTAATFQRLALQAIAQQGTAVAWSMVERQTAHEAIVCNRQSPVEVGDVIAAPCTGAGRKSSAVTYFNKKRLDSFTPHS